MWISRRATGKKIGEPKLESPEGMEPLPKKLAEIFGVLSTR
jgi:hypothetical protein